MSKVSVIMPSLNVAQYIRECMDSVLGQTLEDIEIIAVDAGSEDGTLEILREYEARNSRVRVIVSNQKSYGYQMNLGLDAAQGEYVGIVETDDFIEPDMYRRLAEAADKFQLDYVKGYAYEFYDLPRAGRYTYEIARIGGGVLKWGKVVCPMDMPELLSRDIFLWLGLYRRSFLKEIRFNETAGAAYQDQGFLLKTLGSAKRAMYIDVPVYWYRHDNMGASLYNPKGFHFIQEEYTANEGFLPKLCEEWVACFYTRLWEQIYGRYAMMALSGTRWPGIHVSVDMVREKLEAAQGRKQVRYEILGATSHALLKLFLLQPGAVYDFCVEMLTPKLERAKQILSWAAEQDVLIYGAGQWGKFAHALLAKKGKTRVVAFVDANPDLQGTKMQGIDVLAPEEAMHQFPEAQYFVANKEHGGEIEQFLLGNGIEPQRICRQRIERSPDLLMADYEAWGERLNVYPKDGGDI